MHTTTRVAVIGLGYVGLPTAVTLAAAGLEVIGVDVDPTVVSRITRGDVHVAEPDLARALQEAVAAGRMTAQSAIPSADAYLVAVPTPLTAGRKPDISHVTAAVKAVAAVLDVGQLIAIESTIPPGTTRELSRMLAKWRPDLRLPHEADGRPDVHLAHCPERVLPGRVMAEITHNDRIIGGITPSCAERAAEVYRTFCRGRVLTTDAETAEVTKLAENAYRDVNIAFANELAVACDRLGVDVWEVRRLANRHPRVAILRPGPGVGGHCVAVDPWFLVEAVPEATPLIRTARTVNERMPAEVVRQVVAAAQRCASPLIACLGLSYKAEVSDLRGSPAVTIVHQVARTLPDVQVRVADPFVDALPAPLAGLANVHLTAPERAVSDATVVALLTDHRCFQTVAQGALPGKTVIDPRGMLRRHT